MKGDEEQQGTGSYDADGRLAGEAWSIGPLAGLHLAQAYNGQGKRQMLTLGSRDREWGRSDFGYDAQGRLATVASGTVSARYEYSAAKTRLPDVHVQNAQGQEVLRSTRAYDALDRLVRIENASLAPDGAATILSSHEYVTNDAGQRLKSTLADGSYWVYNYDRLGQVTGGVKYSAAGQELPGHRFDYRFDDIGNRQSATIPTVGAGTTPRPDLGSQTTYRSNLLNQYTQIQLGPQVSPLTYDADGNLLTDGRWRYTWDAENRLLAVESISNVGAGTTPRLRLLYTYDHQSRRLQRREFAWNETTQNWTAATDTRYLYDGWNCVAEFDGSGALQARYVWGLDLSGSEQGAGGVGGLLFGIWSSPSFQGPVSSFYCYDGNGNVVALASAVDGALQARYDYAPFGETVSAEDVANSNRGTEAAPTLGLAAQNPYRFSTKPQDPVSHLYYYGYRWYSAELGRWLSKDPMGEQEGTNLGGYCTNDGVNTIDISGLGEFRWIWTDPDWYRVFSGPEGQLGHGLEGNFVTTLDSPFTVNVSNTCGCYFGKQISLDVSLIMPRLRTSIGPDNKIVIGYIGAMSSQFSPIYATQGTITLMYAHEDGHMADFQSIYDAFLPALERRLNSYFGKDNAIQIDAEFSDVNQKALACAKTLEKVTQYKQTVALYRRNISMANKARYDAQRLTLGADNVFTPKPGWNLDYKYEIVF